VKSLIRPLAYLLAVAVVFVIGQPSLGQPALTVVHVASNVNDDVTPLLYAQHAHLFEKAGLQVEIAPMNSGSAVTAAVIGGSIDIGKSSILPLVSAHFRKLPIATVAPGELWLQNSPISALVVSKSSGISSAKDLAGKVIAVQALRDFSEFALRDWVDAMGGDSSSLKVIEIPQSSILAALQDGRIAGANMSNPGLATVLASNSANLVGRPDDAIGKHYLLTAWFASTAYIAAHPDVIRKFADVMSQAARYTNTHHAETVPLTAPFWGIDPNVLSHMPRAEIGDRLDAADLQPVVNLAAKYGIIDKPFDAHELIANTRSAK
jgi:NitT/TauT family transport system substrate-binding protein